MVIKKLKCSKCGHKATKDDYLCPNCNSKFRPRSVWIVSGIVLLFGVLDLSILLVALAVGLFLLKQWARQGFIIIVIAQILITIFFLGFDISAMSQPEILISLVILILVFLPLGIFMLLNEEVTEAYRFYGGGGSHNL